MNVEVYSCLVTGSPENMIDYWYDAEVYKEFLRKEGCEERF